MIVGDDIMEGVGAVSDAVVACGILPLLGELTRGGWPDRPSPAALIASYACFANDYQAFGPSERLILDELRIAELAQADWWTRTVLKLLPTTADTKVLAEMATLHAKLRFAADTLPNLMPQTRHAAIERGTSLIRIILPPADRTPTHPLRLAYAIEAVCQSWDLVCAPDDAPARLALLRCDPGVTSAMIFAGPSAQVNELKGLLAAICNHIAITHEASLEACLSAIPYRLPIVERAVDRDDLHKRYLDLQRAVRRMREAGARVDGVNPAQFEVWQRDRPVQSALRHATGHERPAQPAPEFGLGPVLLPSSRDFKGELQFFDPRHLRQREPADSIAGSIGWSVDGLQGGELSLEQRDPGGHLARLTLRRPGNREP